MLQITRDVWDGHDYVPFVWHRWLSQVNGQLIVAELDGRVVGLQNASLHPDGSAWLEGIRVADDVQARGVGHAMLRHALEWARSMGCRAARLSTSSGNPSSNRMAEKEGMEVIGEFLPLSAPSGKSAHHPSNVRIAMGADYDEIWQWLQQSPAMTGFYTEGWTAYRLIEPRLRLLLATSAVLIAGEDTVDALGIATCSARNPLMRLGLLLGTPDGTEQICRWLRSQTGELGFEKVRATLASESIDERILQRAGFDMSHEFTMLLRELRFDG